MFLIKVVSRNITTKCNAWSWTGFERKVRKVMLLDYGSRLKSIALILKPDDYTAVT